MGWFRWVMLLSAAALAGVALWYLSDLRRAKARVAEARVAETPFGPVEYSLRGEGPRALVIHGAGGGHDQGQLIARHLGGAGIAWLAVSRFGYLGSPLPDDASTAAQADAIAALLDELGEGPIPVMGFSGGAPPALQLAARHPEKVSALILIAPAPFSPFRVEDAELPVPGWVYQALFGTNFPYWALSKVAPWQLARIYDVRPDLTGEMTAGEVALVKELVASFLPVTARRDGVVNEAAAIDPAAHYPVERITAPVLIVQARDDGINPFAVTERLSSLLPGAEVHGFDRGGHLLLGHVDEIRALMRPFLLPE